MKKQFVIMFVVLAIMAAPSLAAMEPFRLVFTTSTTHDALSTDIEVYNAWVQGLADAANIGMGGMYGDLEWNVLGSTAEVDAKDNTGTNPDVDGAGVPIYLVDGITKVADDNADLWDGDIDHIIDLDEKGGQGYPHLWVFTGTTLDGTAAPGDFGPLGTPVNGSITQGNGGSTSQWIWRAWTGASADSQLAMYAMSEIIPEPATLALLGLGSLTFLRRKK